MASDWQESTLGDVLELKRGYDLAQRERVKGEIPLISSAGFSDFHNQAKVKAPGVVTGRYGTIGNVFYSEKDFWPLNTTLYVRDFKGNDAKFIYYFLKTIDYHQYSDKAAVPGVNRNHLHLAKVSIPENINEQKAIAYILGSLDDKIELNRQMNATLEEMAQALFKSWFVDFDPVIDNALAAGNAIPDELEAKAAARQALGDARKPLPEDIHSLFPNAFVFTEEMGWIPEGWGIRSLESLITLIGGGTPKTSIEAYWNGDIPWFSVVDAPNPSDVFVIETEKHITRLGVEKSSTKILPIGTTIISARGTVGKCAMVATPMAMNQSCYGIRGIDGISDTFVYYAIYLQVTDLQQKSHGSIFSTITRDTFKSIQMPFSNAPLTVAFDQIVKPYFDKILANSIQAKALTNLRDALLPKLLSGELRILEAAELVEEAIA
jgi:type I restriction enzyme S subunit